MHTCLYLIFLWNINVKEFHLSNQEKSEIIANKFASIQNQYEALKTEDISVPPFTEKQITQFQPSQVWLLLSKLKTNKATVKSDFPAKLSKLFAAWLSHCVIS